MSIKPIIEFIIKDPIRKIFAIIFTFGIWFYVAIDGNYQYKKNIKILYTDLPESLMIVDSIPSIEVLFTGRGGSLLSIWAAPPKARCDLINSKLGKNIIHTKELAIPISFRDVSIDYPDNKMINFTLDKKIIKRLDIVVPIKGSLKEGYSISDVTVLDAVNAIGPSEIISGLRELMTESLDVRERSVAFEITLRLIYPSPLVQLSKEQVSIMIESGKTLDKIFTNIPIKLIYAPNQNVSSEKIVLDTLIVSGPESKIEQLEKKHIEVTIKLTTLSRGEYELPAGVILPDYIKPIYSKPQKFKIKIY